MFAEWLIGVSALIISIVFIINSFTFPEIVADPGGLALFPRALSVITGSAASVLIGQLIWRAYGTNPLKTAWLWVYGIFYPIPDGRAKTILVRQTIYLFFLSAFFPWVILKAGFILATSLFAYSLLSIFGTGKLKNLFFSVVVTAVIYFFFVYLIGAPVSRGVWISQIFD